MRALTVWSRGCREGATPSSGSVWTLRSGPRWASAGWTWRSRPAGNTRVSLDLGQRTHTRTQKTRNGEKAADDPYVSSVVGSLLSVVRLMAVAGSAIVEGVCTRCGQNEPRWKRRRSESPLMMTNKRLSAFVAHMRGSLLRRTCWRGPLGWCRPRSPCGSRSRPCESDLGCWAHRFPSHRTAASCPGCSAQHTHSQSLKAGHTHKHRDTTNKRTIDGWNTCNSVV